MRLALTALATLALGSPLWAAAPQSPYGVYLDFEDLQGSGSIPADYGSVDHWGSWTYTDAPDASFPPLSGTTAITSSLPQAPIEFGESIIFRRAAVVTAQPFAWKFYYRGQHVHTSPTLPNLGGPPAYLDSGYGGFVDMVEFLTSGNSFVVDDLEFDAGFDGSGGFGQAYCTASANSTGVPAQISLFGNPSAAANDFRLEATDLPVNQFGIFLTSRERGFMPLNGISNGPLCLGGEVRRFVGPGQILLIDSQGVMDLQIDLTSIPEGNGTVGVMAGETWRFQGWYRDPVMTGNNLTAAKEATFN